MILFSHWIITSAERAEQNIIPALLCVLISQQICRRLKPLPGVQWSPLKWVTPGSAGCPVSNTWCCGSVESFPEGIFRWDSLIGNCNCWINMHLALFFIKLRHGMFIKKKNFSSKLEQIVNQTNCSPARLLQLLCWKWGDTEGRVFEQRSGGQNSLQSPVLKYCTAAVSVAATHVKMCWHIKRRTVRTPFICVSLDTDPGCRTEDPWGFSPGPCATQSAVSPVLSQASHPSACLFSKYPSPTW